MRDAYQCHEISNIGFVRGPNNHADGMTKLGNCEPLIHLLRTGKANCEAEQWFLRLKKGNDSSDQHLTIDYSQELSHSIEKATAENTKPPKKISSRKNNGRAQKQSAGINYNRVFTLPNSNINYTSSAQKCYLENCKALI